MRRAVKALITLETVILGQRLILQHLLTHQVGSAEQGSVQTPGAVGHSLQALLNLTASTAAERLSVRKLLEKVRACAACGLAGCCWLTAHRTCRPVRCRRP